MDLIETIDGQVDETFLQRYREQLSTLRGGGSYENADPETVIFYKKQLVAKRLLEIPAADLSTAPKQDWYGEYIALLEIRLENPALRLIGKEYAAELLLWYNERIKTPERELAILGMIQFIDPLELTMPFNQNLWHRTMKNDVQAIFMNYSSSVNYSDEEISTYRLARQAEWRHDSGKIRVVFLVHSHITCDKVLPVYEAMKQREDFAAYLVVFPDNKYKHGENSWAYFRKRYPDDTIYDGTALVDVKRLRPDYVFFTNPYEGKRPAPNFSVNHIMKFAKVCVIAYGASLAYTFLERLLDDYPHFWRNVYLLFGSTPAVNAAAAEKFPRNLAKNLQHFEFWGYPALKAYYNMPAEPSDAKRILWTPRWIPAQKNQARIGGSHFLEYKDDFISLRQRYGDKVELFFRPHMNLFRGLISAEIMTREQVIAYRRSLKANRIVRHTTLADMDESIRNVDIFLSDYSTILVAFFLTGRPIIYCEFENAVPFPEYAEMFAAMYIAHSWADVERYLDDLVAGNDPLFEIRQAVAKKIYDAHKDATEKIIDRLVQDFNDTLEGDE